jgi:sensor histidine kinase regulating citrate/malate metabolism
MRLITKINSYFAVILILLMASVFVFTHFFIQKEFQNQVENSLQVTFESFKLTLENINIIKGQEAKAFIQTRGDVIGIATRDHLASVLFYYLSLAAIDYNLDLIEVIDKNGFLLADNNHAYDTHQTKLYFKKPPANNNEFYFAKRDKRVYLITTTPVIFSHQLVGYLNFGTPVDEDLVAYFSSVLHSKLLFYVDNRLLAGNSKPVTIPSKVLSYIKKFPSKSMFLPGNKIKSTVYDYIFFTVPSEPGFTGIIGIAHSRSEVLAALLRLNVFLWALAISGLVFGSICANLLARNIKKSIFGMEPKEIASLLDQRTTIIQSTFEGIIALNQEGLITLVNNEAKQILPTDLEMIGEPAANLFQDLKIQEVLATGQAIYNQHQVIGETIIVYNCVPIKTRNIILGAVITLRDLTEFQKVAEELVEVKNYTQALRSQSHEFMNKMQSVSGLIQLGKYETALTLLHETTESHQDLISILNNAFSTSAVSGILLGKHNRAKELNIQFEIEQTSHIPKGIIIPDNELVCIVGNLIENAFEALRESRQVSKKVWVKIYPHKGFLRITVIDNGPGISKAIQGFIFERGFTTKKGLNKGIGLSLVRQSVENLRGIIRIHCNKQTVFMVRIPLKNGGPDFVNDQIIDS